MIFCKIRKLGILSFVVFVVAVLNHAVIIAQEQTLRQGVEPVGGYLFAHMTDSDYGRLYYSVSSDGMKWQLLNDGKRVLKEYRGHPDICRGHDGRYYLLGNTETGPDIRIWVSSDLMDWKPFKTFRADLSTLPEFDILRPWHGAPKMFFDDKTKQYIITWHTRLKKTDPHMLEPHWTAMRTLYMLSEDLETFSKPKRLFPFEMATIDTFIRRVGDTYYAITKDERFPEDSWPTGKTIRICTSPGLTGPWSKPSDPISPNFREAPTLIPKRDHNGWLLYYEQYPGVRYGCSTAPKLEGPWYNCPQGPRIDYDFAEEYITPKGARHGCMIPISKAEYDAICKKFAGESSQGGGAANRTGASAPLYEPAPVGR